MDMLVENKNVVPEHAYVRISPIFILVSRSFIITQLIYNFAIVFFLEYSKP
jgi:hypothetical protein